MTLENLQNGGETDLPLNNNSPTDSGSSEQGIREAWRDLGRLLWGDRPGAGSWRTDYRQKLDRFTVSP